MSRELALELAVRFHSGGAVTAAEVVNTAEAFATYFGNSTAAPRSTRATKGSVKADPAPTEPLASSPAAEADASLDKAQTQQPAAQTQRAAPAAASPAMTADAFKAVLSKAASDPNVGPVKVRGVLAKFKNPDTDKPAQNFTTLHVSHYAPAAKELSDLIEAAQLLAA